MNAPIVTQNLTKTFGAQAALRSITLELPAGRIIGLLGRNGAGKTTLLNLICGLVLPSSGSCRTLGVPSGELDTPQLAQLGVVQQEARFIDWMRVEQQLAFAASFYPKWDREREKLLLRELELSPERKVGQLSTGDQQKLGIILGVCHHPSLLLLDEPISGLDPIVRVRMLDFIVAMVREDACTIVISSHGLTDVEKIVDWVLCLDQGEVAACAPLDEIQEGFAARLGHPANLEELFPLLIQERPQGRRAVG